jgi:hypothetical protein
MTGLFSNPLILILLVVGAIVPIFNGKTLLQIVLDLLIPKPPAASAQAWQHYTTLAEQALARGDTEAAEKLSLKAAQESAKYRDQEMQFEPGTIIQWIMKLITGGAGGGMMPLLIIGGVLFLVMSGGCPKQMDLPELPKADAADVQPATFTAGPVWPVTPTVWRPSPEPTPALPPEIATNPDPTPALEIVAPPLVSVYQKPAIAPCPPCPPCEATVVRTVPATREVQACGPIRRLLAWRPFRNWQPFGGRFRCR